MLCMDCQLGITTDRHCCSKQADVPMKSLMDKLWAWSWKLAGAVSCRFPQSLCSWFACTQYILEFSLLNCWDLNFSCIWENNTKSDALWSSHGSPGHDGGKDCLIWIVHTNLTGFEIWLKVSQDFNILSGCTSGVYCSSPPSRSRL